MMKIVGFQKLTLLDFPGKVACTVFIGGCNFRCPYCHNSSVVFMTENSEISQEEFFDFLKKRGGILDGVCITGGEPLLHEDTKTFMKKIRDMGYLIKLDTNGAFPERLKGIINDGLVDYIAMDIKNSFSKYEKTAGVKVDIEKIKASINIIMSSEIPYEFRTTVVKGFHNDDSFYEIGKMISSAKNYYLQSFVDSGNLIKEGLSGFDKSEMEHFCQIVSEYIPNVQIRGI